VKALEYRLRFPSFLEITEQERSQRSSALIVLHPDFALAPSLPEVLLAGQGEGLRHNFLAVVKVFVITRSMDIYRRLIASYRQTYWGNELGNVISLSHCSALRRLAELPDTVRATRRRIKQVLRPGKSPSLGNVREVIITEGRRGTDFGATGEFPPTASGAWSRSIRQCCC
jgi:hypothetical protein